MLMYLKLKGRNNFIEWAKENKIDLDLNQYKAMKQYMSYEDLPQQEYFNPTLLKKDEKNIPVTVPLELLVEDKAMARFALSLGDKVMLLTKFPCCFQWAEQQFYYTYDKAKCSLNDSSAMTFLKNNIATYNVIVDRNNHTCYMFTTPKAWENFLTFYNNYLADLVKQQKEYEALCKKLNQEYEEASKKRRQASIKYESIENNLFRADEYDSFYDKLGC